MSFMQSIRAIAGALALVSAAVHAEAPYSFETTPGQLPKTVVPSDYTISLTPDLGSFTFKGHVAIKVIVLAQSRTITLNALDLKIASATLTAAGGASRTLESSLDAAHQTLTLTSPTNIEPGAYDIAIDYSGLINAEPQGLFYDKYPTAKGEKILLGTQMEPTDARRMLPCWDEPVFRATFQLSVDVPANFTAFSNTPAERVNVGKMVKHVDFARTPKMASYLVVFVAGEMDRISGMADGTHISVAATDGRQAGMDYALKSTAQILPFYNSYFGIKFPLPKLDQLALPGGFSGAMENWGGITYNETALLYDPAKSADDRKQRVFEVIAHEMAHQWFGDLVTMAWWDNLWLNEGFASWMGTKATDAFNPTWKMWLQANADRERAMSLDARKTTHPIQQPVANESDANDAFDDITYLKGQSFIRMLETYLGEDVFRAGIRDYMQLHQYGSTTTGDLWVALEKSSGKPVSKLAAAWTTQPGFPLISVKADPCKDGARVVRMSQEHFTVDDSSDATRRWPVPISFGAGAARTAVLLEGDSGTASVADCKSTLVVDPEATGYYRVQYSSSMQAEIVALLPTLPATARLKILSDNWALAAAGRADLRSYFDLVSRLGDEPERAVWEQVTGRLEFLDGLADPNTPEQKAIRSYGIALLHRPFARLGWEPKPGEGDQVAQLRATLIDTLAALGDASVIAEAQKRFAQFVVQPSSLPASLKPTIVHIAGANADEKVYAQLQKLAADALTTEDRLMFYQGLWAAHRLELASLSLATAIDPKTPQLVVERVVGAVARDGNQRVLAWQFTKSHVDEILKRMPMFRRNQFLGGVIGNSTDQADADDLIAIAARALPPDAQTEAQRSADGIRSRATIKSRLMPQLDVAIGTR
jgi:aminopeptidase N